ncbi:MAG: hypothetical protein GX091_05675 [Peptococcaceae bacterium]|nr:hypothetical protein [Peptococcaceae bacterium]
MSAKIIKIEKDEAIFQIEIDAETYKKALIEEYRRDLAIRGENPDSPFSEKTLQEYHNLKKISEKAVDKLFPAYYLNAIKKLELQPMSFPRIKFQTNNVGQPCVIEVRVILEPEVKIQKIEGLEVDFTPVIVTEEDIEQQLAVLREQHGAANDDVKLLQAMHFDSMDALKAEIRQSLESWARDRTEWNKKTAVMKQLLAANPIEINEEVIEEQIMLKIEQMQNQMGPHGFQAYLESNGLTIDDMINEVRPQAEAKVKKGLILSAVADKLSPEVTEEDIKTMITKQSDSYLDSITNYEARRKQIDKTPGALDQLKQAIRMEKAAEYILAQAVFHENQSVRVSDELANMA